MMLPEMTRSARVVRAFLRFARGAGVGLALGALAACGGGGGGGSSTPAKTIQTPEMTITPVPLPVPMDQLEAATISAGETVEATLESADDVKYYRLDVAETSVVELTLDAEAGTEVALMHRNGVVLTRAITASEVTTTGVVVSKGTLYVRVREAVEQLAAVERNFSLVSKVTKIADRAGVVINIARDIPKVDVPIGGGEVNVDLTGVFQRSDNGPVAFRVDDSTGALAVHLKTLAVHLEKTRIESTDEKISARVRADGSAMPGDVELTLCASPLAPPITCIPWTVTLVEASLPLLQALVRRKPGVPETSPVNFIQAGGTFTSEPVGSYFEYVEGATVRYTLTVVGDPPRTAGWSSAIVDERVRISSASDIDGGSDVVVRLTITASTDSGTNPRTAWVDFRVRVNNVVARRPRLSFKESDYERYLLPGATMYTSEPLGEYFEYDGTSVLTFSSSIRRQEGTGWGVRITEDGKLEVSQSGTTLGHYVGVEITATSRGTATSEEVSVSTTFYVQIARVVCCEDPTNCSCDLRDRTYNVWLDYGDLCSYDFGRRGNRYKMPFTREVTSCPKTGRRVLGASPDPVDLADIVNAPQTATRDCCINPDRDDNDIDAGLRIGQCHCENNEGRRLGSNTHCSVHKVPRDGWRNSNSCSVSLF